MDALNYTHQDLVRIAAKWLGKKHCILGTEFTAWATAESPDAIGWDYQGISTLIECKVSAGDYQRDRRKAFRSKAELGMGNYRYYAAPPGLINPQTLPRGWGLLETTGRGSLVQKVASLHFESNMSAERVLLVQISRSVHDPEYRDRHKIAATVGKISSYNHD